MDNEGITSRHADNRARGVFRHPSPTASRSSSARKTLSGASQENSQTPTDDSAASTSRSSADTRQTQANLQREVGRFQTQTSALVPLMLVPASKEDIVTAAVATVGVASPWWLPNLDDGIKIAALIYSIVATIWIARQIWRSFRH